MLVIMIKHHWRYDNLDAQAHQNRVLPPFVCFETRKRYFDSKGLKKLPSYKALQAQIEQLIKEKNALYNEYHEAKDKDKELGTVRHNIDQILNGELTRKQEQKKKSQEQEI